MCKRVIGKRSLIKSRKHEIEISSHNEKEEEKKKEPDLG